MKKASFSPISLFQFPSGRHGQRRGTALLIAAMALSVSIGSALPVQAHMAPIHDDDHHHRHHHHRHHPNGFIHDVPNPDAGHVPKIIHDVPNPDPGPSPHPNPHPNHDPGSNSHPNSHPDSHAEGASPAGHEQAYGNDHVGSGAHRDGYDGRRRGWDRRWDDNWGNSWASYDNDSNVITHKRTVHDVDVQKNQQNENWTSIAKPGMEIPNFHEVHPWLFRGGQPTTQGLDQLYNMGVRTVVDLRADPEEADLEKQLCEEHGLKFVNIAIAKNRQPTDNDVHRFMQVVDYSHAHPDAGSVYVHCHHGGDRTGCMVAMYRIAEDKYSYADAHNEMLRYGFDDSLGQLTSAVKRRADRPRVD